MISIIEELFAGRVQPAQCTQPKDPEYLPLLEKVNSEMDYFRGILSEEDALRFLELDDLKNHVGSLSGVEYFSSGFHLGALLMMELLSNPEPVF